MAEERTGFLRGPGLDVRISLVPWDTRALGDPVAQIDHLELHADKDPSTTVARLVDWLDERDVRLVSCRLDSLRLRETMLLEDIGFRFIEMVYEPHLTGSRLERFGEEQAVDDEIAIRSADKEDRDDLEAMAASAFTTGRHVLDWRLPRHVGQDRFRRWFDDVLSDDDHDVLMASIDGSAAGFLVVEPRADDVVHFLLSAVAAQLQGQGVGKRMWRAAVAQRQAEGVRRIETTISAHNTAVMNLCASLGFRFAAPQATFHWVRR